MEICILGEGAIGGRLATHAGHRISAEVQLIASDDPAARGPQHLLLKLRGTKFSNKISTLTGAACDRILYDVQVRGFVTPFMPKAPATGKLGAVKSSTLQYVETGRPAGLNALIGAARETARQPRRAKPSTDSTLGLSRMTTQTRGLAA